MAARASRRIGLSVSGTATTRSGLMARVRSHGTSPERAVRSIVHGLGFRYRLNLRSLPGTPDLVLTRCRTAIFVHGCFWHRHRCARGESLPKTRRRFWESKFDANVQRDGRAIRKLRLMGWSVIVVWECQTKNPSALTRRLARLLGNRSRPLTTTP